MIQVLFGIAVGLGAAFGLPGCGGEEEKKTDPNSCKLPDPVNNVPPPRYDEVEIVANPTQPMQCATVRAALEKVLKLDGGKIVIANARHLETIVIPEAFKNITLTSKDIGNPSTLIPEKKGDPGLTLSTKATVQNMDINGQEQSSAGIVLQGKEGDLKLDHVKFSNNSVGLLIKGGAKVEATDVEFITPKIGVLVEETGSSFTGNPTFTEVRESAIVSKGGKVAVKNLMLYNTATTQSPGILHATNGSEFTIEGGVINNLNVQRGPFAFIDGGRATLIGLYIYNNDFGGSLFEFKDALTQPENPPVGRIANMMVRKNRLTDVTAPMATPTVYVGTNWNFEIANATFVQNNWNDADTAIDLRGGNSRESVQNNIFVYNQGLSGRTVGGINITDPNLESQMASQYTTCYDNVANTATECTEFPRANPSTNLSLQPCFKGEANPVADQFQADFFQLCETDGNVNTGNPAGPYTETNANGPRNDRGAYGGPQAGVLKAQEVRISELLRR